MVTTYYNNPTMASIQAAHALHSTPSTRFFQAQTLYQSVGLQKPQITAHAYHTFTQPNPQKAFSLPQNKRPQTPNRSKKETISDIL